MKIKTRPITTKEKELLIDGFIAFLLAAIMGVISLVASGFLDKILWGLEGLDFWFQADIARVYYNMVDADFSHYRTSVHPLFSLVGYLSTLTVDKIFHLSQDGNLVNAVRLVIALVASLWLASFYILLRLLFLQRLDAVLFALLGACSSASLFWFSIPETYSFGSLSILMALIVAALTQHRNVSEGWFVVSSAATLSFTVTNWMAGLAATFINLNWWKAIRVTIIALLLVCLLWWIERQLFPTAQFFLNNSEEANYFFREEAGGPFRILLSFFSSSMIMPDIELVNKLNRTDWKVLTVQHAWPWSGSFLGGVAVFSWLILLCIGCWNLFFGSLSVRIRLTIGITLLGQLGLHLIYGDETFLYALHFLPLLVIVAALGARSQLRKIVLIFAFLLLCTGGLNNVLQFHDAGEIVMQHFYPPQVK